METHEELQTKEVEPATNPAETNMDTFERRRAFGDWLRQKRHEAGLTQAQLAKALNYDSSQIISNIERGTSLLPSRRLPDFARELKTSPLEMEVRYFQCSARNTAESRMPEILLKYLPLIQALEQAVPAAEHELLNILRQLRPTPPSNA